MNIKQSVFGICLLATASACSSLRQIEIETFNPSAVNFPATVERVLIANHAVPQPKGSGLTMAKQSSPTQKAQAASVDSALFDACKALGETLVLTEHFADVRLYDGALRAESSDAQEKKLSQAEVKNLCDAHHVDAIITLDHLFFEQKRSDYTSVAGQLMGTVKVKMQGFFRAYMPEREQPFALVQVADSLRWEEYAASAEELSHYLPSPTNAYREAARYMAARSYHYFAPHWDSEYRWYYTHHNFKWKEASSYANLGYWDKAAKRWEEIFDTSTSAREKARAASNIALAKEMSGAFRPAYEWLFKSYELFKKEVGESDKETQLTKLYITALSERIREDKKFNQQFDAK